MACFLSIPLASAQEPHKYGDPDFYVKLQDVEVSEGRLDPPWDRQHNQYELNIPDWRPASLTMNLVLDIGKYDLMFTPKIELNGEEIKYTPIADITVAIPLNKTHGAVDQTEELKLSDPHPAEGGVMGFFGPKAAKNVYKIRVRQSPEMDKVVDAADIKVRDASTKQIISASPAFDTASSKVNYAYDAKETAVAVEVQIACQPFATGSLVDGADAGGPQGWTRVHLHEDVTLVLVQCVYQDDRWTQGNVVQRTYMLAVSRTVQLATTSVDVTMPSQEGFCTRHNDQDWTQGWTCRSLDDHPSLVAIYNNSKAKLELMDSHSGVETTLWNGLPAAVVNPKNGDGEFELVMRAGSNTISAQVRLIRPARCADGVTCPVGSVMKFAKTANAEDHLCYDKTCTLNDDAHCCEEGAPYDIIISDFGSAHEEVVKTLELTNEWSERETDIFIKYAQLPVVAVSGIVRSVAVGEAYDLVQAGCKAVAKKTPDASCTVVLAEVSDDADTDKLVEILTSAAGLSKHEATELVDDGGGDVKKFGSQSETEGLLETLKGKGIVDAGALVASTCTLEKYTLNATSFNSSMLNDSSLEDAIQALQKAGASRSQATEVLKNLPGMVATKLDPAQAALLRVHFVSLGATVEVARQEHEVEEVPWYLVDACDEDFESPKCQVGNPRPKHNESNSINASCDYYDHECPSDAIRVINGTCHGPVCSKDDVKRCCGFQVFCRDIVCPLHYGNKVMAWDASCASQDVMEYCCEKSATCDSYTCPEGYLLIGDASLTACAAPTCDAVGKELCCNPVIVCSSYVCPDMMVLKDGASKLFVDALTAPACCDDRATCRLFECPAGLARRPEAELILCEGKECAVNDTTNCCEGAGTCFGFTQCPEHSVVREDPGKISCVLQECTAVDAPSCCMQVSTCETYTSCPDRYVLRPNPASIDCLSANCSAVDMHRCCQAQAVCGSMECPEHFGLIQDKADFTFCASETCGDVDIDVCCRPQESCVSLEPPDRFMLRDSAASLWVNDWEEDDCWMLRANCSTFNCPMGFTLRANASRYNCSGEVCSDVDAGSCCEQAPLMPKTPFIVNVTNIDSGKDCAADSHDSRFWCQSDADTVDLVIRYQAQGKEAVRKPLSAIAVPAREDGPKHITVILRDSNIETTRLSIWVYRFDWQSSAHAVASRRLQGGARRHRAPAIHRLVMFDVGAARSAMRRAAAAAQVPKRAQPSILV